MIIGDVSEVSDLTRMIPSDLQQKVTEIRARYKDTKTAWGVASLPGHMTRVFMLIPSVDLGRASRIDSCFCSTQEDRRGIQRCLLVSGENKCITLTHVQPSCVRNRDAK